MPGRTADEPGTTTADSGKGHARELPELPEPPIIRAATPGDALGIGRVSVRAWRAGYRGLMPDAYLAGLDAVERARFWRGVLADRPVDRHALVAASPRGVVGFATFGPEDVAEPTGRGELYSLNVEPGLWGAGVAGPLLEAAEHGLAAGGYGRVVLWVMPGNQRARRFYERHGWSVDAAQRVVDVFGINVTLVAYGRVLPG